MYVILFGEVVYGPYETGGAAYAAASVMTEWAKSAGVQARPKVRGLSEWV